MNQIKEYVSEGKLVLQMHFVKVKIHQRLD